MFNYKEKNIEVGLFLVLGIIILFVELIDLVKDYLYDIRLVVDFRLVMLV